MRMPSTVTGAMRPHPEPVEGWGAIETLSAGGVLTRTTLEMIMLPQARWN